jgi:hypothetical protein
MMATTAAGPFVLPALGPAMTAVVCGSVAATAALVGLFGRPANSLGPDYQPLAAAD